jgi:hypothetical protein
LEGGKHEKFDRNNRREEKVKRVKMRNGGEKNKRTRTSGHKTKREVVQPKMKNAARIAGFWIEI